MSHRPTQTGIYADDLTKKGFDDIGLPKDIYDNPQYYTYMYGETPDVMNETMAQLNAVRGNPNGQVNIYRATTGDAFNDGDWITLSPTYAENHLRDQLGGNGRVISQKVNVHDIQHAGDDLAEWGFYPQQRVLPDETQSMLKKLVSQNAAVDKIKNSKNRSKAFDQIFLTGAPILGGGAVLASLLGNGGENNNQPI